MPDALRQVDYKQTAESLNVYGGESVHENVKSALGRGLHEITPAFFSHDGHIVIVGSGPSLPQFIGEIRAEREKGRPICAIKGAHDYLVENDLIPELFVSIEAQDKTHQLKHKNPHTVYLLASRVHPEMFNCLKGHNVMLWHSWAETELFKEFKGKLLVGGGTTSGLRALTLFYVLGFRNFILYGFDSCLAGDGKTKRFTGEQAGMVVDRWVGGRRFLCNGAMALQADEVQELVKVMPDMKIKVKGDGLIAAIWAERKRLGFNGVLEK